MISIEDRLKAANEHRNGGRSESALVLYQLVLDINPANREALKCAAVIQAEFGKLNEALDLVVVAVAQAPDDLEALSLLATLAAAAGDKTREAAAIDQILAVDPHGPLSATHRADKALADGDVTAVERILVEALTREPDNTHLLKALSRTYFSAGIVRDALALAQRAVELRPEDESCLSLLAGQMEALGDHRGALSCWQRAMLAAPANLLMMASLADCHAHCGELSEAHRLASRVIALRPDLLPGWRAFVRIAILRGEGEMALKRFSEAARSHAERFDALICLADCYRLAGLHAASLKLLEPLAGRAGLSPLQTQVVTGLRREAALAIGDFDLAASIPIGLDLGSVLTPAEGREETAIVCIPPTMPVNEAVPLLRLGQSLGRPVELHGPEAFADLVALIPGARFVTVAPDSPMPPVLPLPALVGTVGISLDGTRPYLQAPDARRRLWRDALMDFPGPRVALAWNDGRPGLMLDDLRPILGRFAGTFISVMWGEGRHQLSSFPDVIDAGARFEGIADVAALLAECDAIIGPDCLPLHVAGAMGRPGLLLAQPNAPWYWQDREARSVWYPSIEVLRTGKIGHWAMRRDDVMDGLAFRLAHLATQSNGNFPLQNKEIA